MRAVSGFPSEQPDIPGVLSDFYLGAHGTLKGAAARKYSECFRRIALSDAYKSHAEARLMLRMAGRKALGLPNCHEVEDIWRNFLKHCPEDDPLHAKLASRVLEEVGNY